MIYWRFSRAVTLAAAVAAATLLPDGQVLMAGGTLFDHPHVLRFLASAELYTP